MATARNQSTGPPMVPALSSMMPGTVIAGMGLPTVRREEGFGYPNVRLTLFWNLAGVIPVTSLKIRVKWLCDEKPRSRATLARELSVFSISSDLKMRRRLTKRLRLSPVDWRNFLAKWLGDSPVSVAILLSEGAISRCAST